MDNALPIVAGIVGVVYGWFLPNWQQALYSEPEYRSTQATGQTLWLLRIFSVVSAGAGLGLAFREELYDFGPALITAIFVVILVTISSTDFERRRIPNKVTYPAFVAALALCWAWPDRTVQDILLGAGVGTAAAVLLVGLGVFFGSGGVGLGIGDGKLMILMGAMIGWPGVVPALFYGVLGAGLVAVVLMVTKGRGATFSYGPYLAAGAALILLFPQLR
ncbi:MAG: prepilin peptidase [Dehalococcoidia bacterium]